MGACLVTQGADRSVLEVSVCVIIRLPVLAADPTPTQGRGGSESSTACVCVCRVGSVRAAEQQEVISPQSAARFRFILAERVAGVELEQPHTSTNTIPPPLLLADQNMKMVLSQRQREEL